MTELLERAIEQLKSVADDKQDAIATLIMKELAEEERWDTTFAKSQDLLADLASEAMAEYRAGNTQALDPEKL